MEVESLLKETWKFFENSPKRTIIFMKVQTELKDVALTERAKKIVGKNIRKACHTRWLSLEQSVNSVFETYAALLCRGHPTPTKSLGHVICDHEVEMNQSRRDDIKSCFIMVSVLIFDSVGLQQQQ